MKKIFKTLTILTTTTVPLAVSLSCSNTQSVDNSNKKESDATVESVESIKKYENPDTSKENLKKYFQALVSFLNKKVLTNEERTQLHESYYRYFPKNFTTLVSKEIKAKDEKKLEELLSILTSTQFPKEGFSVTADQIKKNVRSLKNNIEKTIAEIKEEKGIKQDDNLTKEKERATRTTPLHEPTKQENADSNSEPKNQIEFKIADENALIDALDNSEKEYINLYFHPSTNSFNQYGSNKAILTVPANTPELSGLKSDGKSTTKSIKVFGETFEYKNKVLKPIIVKDGYVVVQYVLNGQTYLVDLKLSDQADNSEDEQEDNTESDNNQTTKNQQNNM
ncbi:MULTISPECIES: hypothetical protein [unclassified Mycoplasma]|uniref:hypothetical protein n=1 Tax=unclassified Mycoplasma TaxID=2683645 RepID=UPI00211CC375|nr:MULTISPECIES: hypothetical protein [unclassified Mycoplasma]UUM19859.1 hypothetical protein NPA11_00245 [Mycoplasma sp. 1578d]UUM24843.1 hypothetical protein NPA12_00245 [Mycoplasma sp. 3686d]